MTPTRLGWFAIAAMAATAIPAAAQDARGSLLGRVTDATDAVIVEAAVKAINVDTGVRYSSLTNGSGDYLLPFLLPGTYTITAERPGFKTYTRSGIAVRQNDRVTIDVVMQVGDASQSVQVASEAP